MAAGSTAARPPASRARTIAVRLIGPPTAEVGGGSRWGHVPRRGTRGTRWRRGSARPCQGPTRTRALPRGFPGLELLAQVLVLAGVEDVSATASARSGRVAAGSGRDGATRGQRDRERDEADHG